MNPRCDKCGRFIGNVYDLIPVRDSIHPYTADYLILCPKCVKKEGRTSENDNDTL